LIFKGTHQTRTAAATAQRREAYNRLMDGGDLPGEVRFILEAADDLRVCDHCDARPCFDCRGASLADCAPAVTKYIQERETK